jgi:hypothetical protein
VDKQKKKDNKNKRTSFVGFRCDFWLFSFEEKFIGDIVSIFREGDQYWYGVVFEGDEVVGVNIGDIRMIKKLKKIKHNFQLITLDQAKKKADTDGN